MRKSKSVMQAELHAHEGNPEAMELLARRFFDGRGVEQCHLMSYVWSSIASTRGVKHLDSLRDFSFKKLNPKQLNTLPLAMAQTRDALPPMGSKNAA